MNEINTVKIQGQGYLLNGTMLVPKADGNREYELIKQWLEEGNTPEPEFTEEELAQKAIQDKIAEANSYLKETDWVETYKLRHDLGLELIPEESSKWVFINKREEYKVFLKNLEGGGN